MSRFKHPYIRFRTRLAHYALLQFLASFKSSLEITLIVFAPVLLGLLAFIALPGLYAATLAWPAAAGLVLAQALLGAAPVWLLRKRLLPQDVLHWRLPLPVPPRVELSANGAVAGILMGPLAIAYAVSIGVWLYQWPTWLRPVALAGIGATALSLMLSWAGATLVLTRRSQAPSARPGAPRAAAAPTAPPGYLPRGTRPRLLFLWRQLYWLPFWRADNQVGLQQSLLLLLALAGALLWLYPLAVAPAALLGALSSATLVLLTDRGDKAVREQIALLRPSMAAWPLQARWLERLACLFSLAPAALVLCAGAMLLLRHGAGYSHKAAWLYLAVAGVAQLAIVGLPTLSPRGRVSLVIVAILMLSAIGSELWN